MKKTVLFLLPMLLAATVYHCSAQYVQPEKDDTTRLFPKADFDSVQTKEALQEGKSTIKGVAFVIGKSIKTAPVYPEERYPVFPI